MRTVSHSESFVKTEIKANSISIFKDWLYFYKVNSSIKEHSVSEDFFLLKRIKLKSFLANFIFHKISVRTVVAMIIANIIILNESVFVKLWNLPKRTKIIYFPKKQDTTIEDNFPCWKLWKLQPKSFSIQSSIFSNWKFIISKYHEISFIMGSSIKRRTIAWTRPKPSNV